MASGSRNRTHDGEVSCHLITRHQKRWHVLLLAAEKCANEAPWAPTVGAVHAISLQHDLNSFATNGGRSDLGLAWLGSREEEGLIMLHYAS